MRNTPLFILFLYSLYLKKEGTKEHDCVTLDTTGFFRSYLRENTGTFEGHFA